MRDELEKERNKRPPPPAREPAEPKEPTDVFDKKKALDDNPLLKSTGGLQEKGMPVQKIFELFEALMDKKFEVDKKSIEE